jgi:hypothetical protein
MLTADRTVRPAGQRQAARTRDRTTVGVDIARHAQLLRALHAQTTARETITILARGRGAHWNFIQHPTALGDCVIDHGITIARTAAAVSVIDIAAELVAEVFVDLLIAVVILVIALLDRRRVSVGPHTSHDGGAAARDTERHDRPTHHEPSEQTRQPKTQADAPVMYVRRAFQRTTPCTQTTHV